MGWIPQHLEESIPKSNAVSRLQLVPSEATDRWDREPGYQSGVANVAMPRFNTM